jgi:phage N-6-adenine-methyltransferase
MQEWETPKIIFDRLNKEFIFTLDLAASSVNAKCTNYYSKSDNAFKHTWNGICWLNPPFGSKEYPLRKWIEKAYRDSKKGATVVILLPVRSNTNWWHEFCMHAKEVRFIRGRLKFGDMVHGLPQPLAIVIFENHKGGTQFTSFDCK